MEELLNKLIEKGWKPFGKKPVDIKEYCSWERYTRYFDFYNIRINREDTICERPRVTDNYSLRDIVSKESGLWQFVCENKMVRLETDSWESDSYKCYYNCDGYPKDDVFEMERDDYRFRLLESALKDESELESFILDNIKV